MEICIDRDDKVVDRIDVSASKRIIFIIRKVAGVRGQNESPRMSVRHRCKVPGALS